MMRFFVWILGVLLAPALVLATELRPSENPPADFPGEQYVDSRGCVFRLDEGGGWAARLARDGTMLCGYPPSVSIRGAEGRPRLRALDPDAGKTRAQLAEEALMRAVVTNLRPGELATDPAPLEQLPDMGPEPAAAGPIDELRASLGAASAIQNSMGRELQPNRRLCRLLGHGDRSGEGAAARDPTRGYCDSLQHLDLSRLAVIRPVTVGRDAAADRKSREEKVVRPSGKSAKAAAQPAVKPVRKSVSGPSQSAAKARSVPAVDASMIPAGARHVQVARITDQAKAEGVARRLSEMGYAVRRGRLGGADGQAVLLAGPFETREAIVRALDRLRRAGFSEAVPR